LLFLSSGSEIIGGALASVLIVIKGLGRKKTIIFMFLMQALFAMMTYFFDGTYLVWATLSRFFNTISFIFTYQFTAELYPTKIRTTGIGMANGIGRIGGVVMPWICFSMSDHDLFSPFLLFGSLSIFTAVINLTFPIDTEGK
jgi:MFS family permease